MSVNFVRLIKQYPDESPDDLFDIFCRANGYETRFDDAPENVWQAWLSRFWEAKQQVGNNDVDGE